MHVSKYIIYKNECWSLLPILQHESSIHATDTTEKWVITLIALMQSLTIVISFECLLSVVSMRSSHYLSQSGVQSQYHFFWPTDHWQLLSRLDAHSLRLETSTSSHACMVNIQMGVSFSILGWMDQPFFCSGILRSFRTYTQCQERVP